MTDVEKRIVAARFAADWKGRGDEKQETSLFWIALLQKVYGVEEPDKCIAFEVPVKLDHTSFIDGYIESTRVLIEQKGRDIDLSRGYKQSDGAKGKRDMKKSFISSLIIMIMVLILSSCGQPANDRAGIGETPSWQEQYDLGIRYLSEGNYEEAIIAFTAAIEIDLKQVLAYVGRGDAYVLSGETEENLTAATADYETAIELDETITEAYLGLADVYIRQGNYEKAREILEQGLEYTGSEALQTMLDSIFLEEVNENGKNAYGATAFTLRDQYVPFLELTSEQQDLIQQAASAVMQDDRDVLLALVGSVAEAFANRQGKPWATLYTMWNQHKVGIEVRIGVSNGAGGGWGISDEDLVYLCEIQIRSQNNTGYYAEVYNQQAVDIASKDGNSYREYYRNVAITTCPCVDWQWNGTLSKYETIEELAHYDDGRDRKISDSVRTTGSMKDGLKDGHYISFQEGTWVWSDGTVDDYSHTDERIFANGKCIQETIGSNTYQQQEDSIHMIGDTGYSAGDPDDPNYHFKDLRFW